MLSLRSILAQTLLAVAAIAPLAHGQFVGPGVVTGDTFTHDPTVVKKPDGSYLMAFTADNVGLKTSTDRTAWHDAGAAFPNGAPWTTPYTKGDLNLWAPDISYRNGQYYLYYSASSFGSSVSAIFLATSPTGQSGSWTNQGLVIESNANSNYNCIDPNLVVDAQGRWWMTFGSFWSGIKMVALDPSTGKRSDNNLLSIAARPANGGELEAPYIHRKGNYYYLWLSFDRCCNGAASTYRTMVGRSTSVTGPYVDRNGVDMMNGGGTEMLRTHDAIYGPGHPAVFTDVDADVLVYHYYRPDGVAQIGINLLRYENGWPVIY
ncbi:putative Arabinan endo-1,5-alpha-L-arabinosidase [Emericellopsis atlantica]|uniref:Arabinan endo-1,5-alpha-L-arabinosidase n=1 Tax=Emericellopsis atlantica TaxID=2614577 RepID=A0A9P7ZSM8_9HYPO|nr:putative Arabinan endo-1,5-alpha-L-arabinosidase [Emericellopsis atlantica]KAG9256923.1 putative Arabinan endo-1,5-alpha-L-arabinosidase [Emericellopsis atlantica]